LTSGNGKADGKAERIIRFMDMAFRNARGGSRTPAPEESDPIDPIALALNGWVSDRACRETFLPLLAREIRDAEAQERLALRDHATMTYWLGRKDALRDLRSKFNEWAGHVDGSTPEP